jgi:antitoxin (DNA-binding transcriptional repressor) of toxin-antitoxin stability system
MTIFVKVGEAKTHLSALLAWTEAEEDIQRGNTPIVKLVALRARRDVANRDRGSQGVPARGARPGRRGLKTQED